jgi:hypothetical protein
MLKCKDKQAIELEPWMSCRLTEGLRTLLAAAVYAKKAQVQPEAFAVSFSCLQVCGLYECDLHWLLSQALLIHLSESTSLGDKRRLFQCAGPEIGLRSCFVLTQDGERFATKICTAQQAPNEDKLNGPMAELSFDVPPRQPRPVWDENRRELHFNGHLIKRFRLPSPNQIAVLAAFEEENWPSKIDDPLPPLTDQDPKRRLHDTIRNLNRCHRLPILRFVGDGTGQGVLWGSASSIPRAQIEV